MKRKMLLVLVLIPIMSFADIQFPDSLLIIHKATGYKLLIGTSPEFVEQHFGKPLVKKLAYKFTSPDYEIWDMVYDGFEIRYETYSMMVCGITIFNNAFCLVNNISIGCSLENVIEAYGFPDYIARTQNGEIVYQYSKFIREINIDGEYTSIEFTFISNKIVEIMIDIVPDV